MKIRKWLDNILAFLTVISLASVIIVVTIQIMSRYLPYTAIWTEELTRYLFIYAICFGAPLALLRGEFINVDLIISKISTSFRRYYEIVIYIAIIVLNVVMVMEGYEFILIGSSQTSATMPFQMSVIHAAILIMSVFLVFYSIVKIVQLFLNKQEANEHFGGEEL
ncbi:TRAP transporter small permease [Bacillus chungangensis]|uniref:TRAP-type C4-dicarboxylate transport system permease small subunit n=1 Tax=Bacillus chungangensis TaxID=587633 RepID=A0ABT9WRI6_9BACI|nr:TRAP transporter small permease [Bacillus chungangensis]MDQ0175911.1 TRAP-type C4-dicarboxylate transport system permease small subunit [Bacillus chungangensis]